MATQEISIAEMARQIEVRWQTLSDFLKGRRSIRVESLDKILKVLKLVIERKTYH